MISCTDEKFRLYQEFVAGELMKGNASEKLFWGSMLWTQSWIMNKWKQGKIILGYRNSISKDPEPKRIWHIGKNWKQESGPETGKPGENESWHWGLVTPQSSRTTSSRTKDVGFYLQWDTIEGLVRIEMYTNLLIKDCDYKINSIKDGRVLRYVYKFFDIPCFRKWSLIFLPLSVGRA